MAPSHRSRDPSLRTTTMLNNHARTQVRPPSPVLRKYADTAQKPSKDYRRATIAHGYTMDKDTSARASRIEKSVSLPRNRHRSNASGLVQKFEEALDATHDGLARWADTTLIETEERCNAELDKVVHRFGGQMKIMSDIEDIVDESFGDQRLVSSRKQGGNDAEKEVGLVLADCMQDLSDTVTQEEENLETLWQQWSEIQADIICLAVEILGKHNIDLEQHSLSDAIVKAISNADLKNNETEKSYAEAEQSVVKFEADINTLHIDTTKMVKAQQKISLVPFLALLPPLTTRGADLESGAEEDAGQHQASHGEFREEQMRGARLLKLSGHAQHMHCGTSS